MGIDDGKIKAFLEARCPEAFQEADIEQFKGMRLAIDAGIYMNKYAFSAHNKQLGKLKTPTDIYNRKGFLNDFKIDILNFTFCLMNRGITPVFCFDGARHPLKVETLKKRAKSTSTRKEKLSDAIQEYESLNPLEVTKDMDDHIMKLRSNDYYFTSDERTEIKNVLQKLGIPCVVAEYEAEKLCASLVHDELVIGVISNDTDCYALGINYCIRKHDFINNTFDIFVLENVIEWFMQQVECDDSSEAFTIFLDMCIFMGCDFNAKIKGIGPAKAFSLIKKHKSIENIDAETNLDIRTINQVQCREMFAYEPSNLSIEDVSIDWSMYDENIRTTIEELDSHMLRSTSNKINRSDLN